MNKAMDQSNNGLSISNKEYVKRTENRKLNGFQEYKMSRFAFGCSFAIFLIIFFMGFNIIEMTFNWLITGLSVVYLAESVYIYIISVKIRKEILKSGAIKSSIRLNGFVEILFICTGNIFSAMSGFTLIKKDKTIEYTLSIYMFLISVSIMLVSSINLFKDYVANYFYVGMGLLGGVTLLYLISMVLISKFITGRKTSKAMLPVAVLLIASAATGNIFALIIGIIIISKLMHKDEDISIEWIDILTRLFRNHMAIVGLFIIAFLLSLSICSYMTFDYSVATDNDYSALFINPCLKYPFGTDNFGRCVFTRIVFGARISLIVGLVSTCIPMVVGGILGAISGYYSGKIDNGIMRVLDILYAVPEILMAIAIVASLGASTVNLILALSISSIPIYARTVRATVMGLSSAEFVEAAKACGARDHIIILKHIIPNSLAPIIVRATMGIGAAVLSTSSLSYLGLGVEPHIPEWGNVLKVGSAYLETSPYLAIFPGLAIIVIVLAFNFFGDGLRDATDPKLK